MSQTVEFIRSNRKKHLDWAIELCRIPSISTRPENKGDVAESVKWTHDTCERIGLKSRIMETGGHPLVYAEWLGAPGQPTVLVYGHVDVQPTGERSLWDADPFEPTVKDDWLICRGSSDDKGQVLLYLRAAEAWLSTEKRLPINVKFLIEAEEEIGSPNLASFVEKHRDLLKCKQIIISDTGMYEDGWPTITYGTRGLVYNEVRLSGPKHDLHSGSHGGVVGNPVTTLAEIIATLHDADGRINIPGFYDDVVNPSDRERKMMATLPFDEAKYVADLGSPAPFGEKGYTSVERRTCRPTLDCNGIMGGFTGPGASTVIPAKALAKISMRLVPNQNADKINKLFWQAIESRCPKTVRLEKHEHGAADPYMAPLDSPFMTAADRALKESFSRDVAYIREGGSLPILPMFKRVLGADSLMLGFASPYCNAHGPNEKVRIPDLDSGAEAVTKLFGYLAK